MEIAWIIMSENVILLHNLNLTKGKSKDNLFFGGKEKDIPESNSTTHDKIY